MNQQLNIVINAVNKGAVDAISKTGKAIKGGFDKGRKSVKLFNSEVNRSNKAVSLLSGKMKALLTGVVVSRIAKGFTDTADSFEQMQVKLDAITKGKGAETLDRINKWALDMPVNTEKAVQAFTMMSAMGLDPTIEKMETLVDTASVFGDDAMERVARALGQMQTLGKLSAEELNQLAEAGINARKYIEEAFGMTVEEVQKSGIEIEKVIEAIMQGLDRDFGGAAQRAQNTWRGMTASLASYWTEFKKQVMDAGLFEYLKSNLKAVLDQLKEWQQSGQLAYWAKTTAEALKTVFEWIGKILTIGGALQYTFANIDKFLTKLNIKYLKLQRIAAKVNSVGFADTSDIDKRIAAEERHLDVIERVKKDLVKSASWQERVRQATEETADAAKKIEPVKTVIDPAVQKQVDDARAAITRLADDTKKQKPAEVQVKADTQKFREEIIQLEDGTWTNMFIPVEADTEPAKEKVSETIEEVNRTEGSVTVSANTAQAVSALADVRSLLAEIRDKVVTVTVRQVTEEAHRIGGMVGLAGGGRLPGYGGGDRIRALLEAGEFVIRKEAVSKYGAALFAALNNLRLPQPEAWKMPAFAAGGPVMPKEHMILELAAGGVSVPLTVAGRSSTTRAAVRELEKELKKMRLSHR